MKYSATQISNYRPDIDGLRAVAIFLVVMYHAFPGLCPSGFIGVDIFFVISGYLITSHILKEVTVGRFSIVHFYARRFRRIVPAMALVLVAIWIAGLIFLWADEFKSLGEHIRYSGVFLENIKLARESNYYDVSSELKPLLHFWSLGVEEQYYLVWPLFLILVFRFPRVWRELFILAIGFLSFVYRFQEPDRTKVDFFYLLAPRFWELMVGGLLAYGEVFPRKFDVSVKGQWLSLFTGAAVAILFGISFLFAPPKNERDYFYLISITLVPTLLTFGLIGMGLRSKVNQYFLAHQGMIFVGKISYPIYLWHWPIFSFLRIHYYHYGQGEPGIVVMTAAIAASCLLALATYRFIEIPAQTKLFCSSKGSTRDFQYIKYALSLMGLIAAVGFLTSKGKLLNGQQKKQEKLMDAYLRYKHDPKFVSRGWRDECNLHTVKQLDPSCYTPRYKKRVFIWGDSHAQHLNYGLSMYFKERDVSVLQIAASLCVPSVKQDNASYCNESNAAALKYIGQTKPDVVVIATDKNHETQPWQEITRKLIEQEVKHVIIIGPVPHWDPSLYQIIARYYLDDVPPYISKGVDVRLFSLDQKMKLLIHSDSKVTYFSLIDRLCKPDLSCKTLIGPDLLNDLIAHDYAHFTVSGSNYVAQRWLGPEIDQHLK